jgi:hypothetical protein
MNISKIIIFSSNIFGKYRGIRKNKIGQEFFQAIKKVRRMKKKSLQNKIKYI